MNIRHIVAFLSVAVLAPASLTAQIREEQKATQGFVFRQGQTVYVTAFHTIEHSTARRTASIPSTNIVDNHLPAEFRIRKDFEKRQVYKLANKASAADFVFLVLIDDSAAEGLAVSPDTFAKYQSPLNMQALREAAYTRSIVGPLKIHNLGRISDHLVRQFHEQEGHARQTPLP